MNDYERVAKMIGYLDSHQEEQPSLPDLANFLGMSQFHFHRLFSEWVGISPKDFLQCLTLEHVKKLLQDGQSVLNAALSARLSGPGRLDDLCITLEAASPGETKVAGKEWQIIFGFADTPFGECIIAEEPRGICYLAFVDGDQSKSLDDLRQSWPEAKLAQDDQVAVKWAAQIIQRQAIRQGSNIRAFVKGTPFQVRVWKALLRIPPNCLITYGRLAAAIGKPTAARAVGSAVGDNLISYLIPCHRVVRGTGMIGGYRWGVIRKRIMIGWESSYGPSIRSTR